MSYFIKNAIVLSGILVTLTGCSVAPLTETSDTPTTFDTAKSEIMDVISTVADSVSGQDAYGIYFSLSENGDEPCTFGTASGCRPAYIEFTQENGVFVPLEETLVWPVFDAPAIQMTLSPDHEKIAFKASDSYGEWVLGELYIYHLQTKEVVTVSHGAATKNSGQWPTWQDNQTLVYTASKDCRNSACATEERTVGIQLSYDLKTGETTTLFQDFDSCDFQDLFMFDGFVAGYGVTNSAGFDDDCPLTSYTKASDQGTKLGPQPLFFNLETNEYVSFDLNGAGLNACAHFSTDGTTWICTEQNTLVDAHHACSDPSLSDTACRQGGSLITYNEIYGWVYDEDSGMMESVRGNQPLFDHVHPTDLPEVERYWEPKDGCQVYKTKQASISGTILSAHSYCQNQGDLDGRTGAETHATEFSRLFLIDIEDPENPNYFDLTTWMEDAFEEWGAGEATSFTSVMFKL
ncbi:hypothetical protein HQ487_01595 [Candidatus Uhrbacteria bacterium]|nr:hypothetical protein [Candidatus Uhrbacteria bacterium]